MFNCCLLSTNACLFYFFLSLRIVCAVGLFSALLINDNSNIKIKGLNNYRVVTSLLLLFFFKQKLQKGKI